MAEVRWAKPTDAAGVLAVWQEVSRWLQQQGMPLWDPNQFSHEQVSGQIAAGEICVGVDVAQRIVACMQVSTTDPLFWPEMHLEPAWYLHKIAVTRSQRGQNWVDALLAWVEPLATAGAAKYLRLDCEPRPALLALYQGAGFTNYDAGPVERAGYRVQRLQRPIG